MIRMLSILFAVLVGLAGSAFGAEPTKEPRTNFVVILCDDLGYGDLSCFGHPVIKTPHLDRLADEGMRLTDCYAAAPVCSPARVGMLTGRTPYRCGVPDWIRENSPVHLRSKEKTVASLLQSAGYATCHVGKWHCNGKFNSPDQPQPGDHGFDHWFSTQNNARPSHCDPVNFVRNGQAVGPLKGYSSTLIVDEAINWLDKRDTERPFCLFVWFHTPHEPVATAERFTAQYADHAPKERAIYFGNVAQMDYEAGRLLGELDRRDLRQNTFVLFTSDNGPETLNRYRGASRSYGSPGPLRGMKLHMYEGGIRVPGIIRWPGHTRPGQLCREPVNGTDVLPTLCAMAGVPVPADRTLDGTSILPIFEGRPVQRRVPLFWRYDRAISEPKLALREGDWKILANADCTAFELYNLADDPTESRNLAKDQPERLAKLAERLRKIHADVEKEGHIDWGPEADYPPPARGKKK